MNDPLEPLVPDLLEWIGPRSRPYAEVIEAWRTSCPRLPVREDANARGYVEQCLRTGATALVSLSAAGVAYLRTRRSTP